MEYVEQSADTLRLYVVSGAVDLDQFTILKESNLYWDSVPVSFGVLGASHFLKLQLAENSFYEICACTDGKFPDTSKLHISKWLHPETTVTEIENSSIVYTHDVHFFDLREINPTDRFNDYTNTQKVSFPVSGHESEAAVTLVGIKLNNQLRIRSIHTYPDECTAVETNSIIVHK